ncbi:MAG: 1-(5-phosphoribosyl)-5-[(5-phosphoribosylamino)methylideneamino]imidazole-4-carboxamide isomerase [Candidatus Limiplasma sp.]|nr:1-(5-phosphoribosyl)-5-[(5-phosphoribosylamino)methylideneamino]imidazole-4-carboxamide isomerase [Candidatus Limiplasma sp.]
MILFPAIDLRGGRVVRLTEGDYNRMTVYGENPVETATSFRNAGASHLHLVDLDGAKDGAQGNLAVISAIVRETGLFIQVGGGARDEASLRRYLDAGAARVILGTMAVENPRLMESLAARYPGKIAVGVDARGGFVAIHGWRTLTNIPALDFLKGLPERGVSCAVYTDISTDGRLSGTNLSAFRDAASIQGLAVVASGGITYEEELTQLRGLGLYGAIIGKALYAGKLDLGRALALVKEGGL